MMRAEYYEYFLKNEIEGSEEVLHNECNDRDDTEIPIYVDLSKILKEKYNGSVQTQWELV